MIEVCNIETWGMEHAARGMRNPMNSWRRSDSYKANNGKFVLGDDDLLLMRNLYLSGPEHRKYLRQIFVIMDISAPLFWWKEMDTYKVGVTANSCSTMHTLHKKPLSLEDFSVDSMDDQGVLFLKKIIDSLNAIIEEYNETGRADLWRDLVCLLPESYNQRRTVAMNYENVVNIITQRKGHKLREWREFVDLLISLPYVQMITGENHIILDEESVEK